VQTEWPVAKSQSQSAQYHQQTSITRAKVLGSQQGPVCGHDPQVPVYLEYKSIGDQKRCKTVVVKVGIPV
jgi:hypothetical protein